MIAKAPDLYGKGLTPMGAHGHRLEYESCHRAGHVKRNQGLHQGQIGGRVDAPGASLHVDVAGPIVPMGIGGVKYILAVVDEWSRFAWTFPMNKKSQSARLLALLVHCINTQVRKAGESGVKRLHTDQAGELKSHSLEEFCQWKGIMHTFTDRAQHEFNGLVERKIGMLNEAVRAALLASDLPAYLWPEVYMAICHTQNLVPSSALQRERRKAIKRQEEYEQEEVDLATEADAAGQEDTAGGQGTSDQGEPGGLPQKKKAVPPEIPIQDMVPHLVFHRDVTNEEFRRLADQVQPWGVPCFVYGRREHIRHLEERGVQGFYMGPGSDPSMEHVFLREPGSGAVKQYMHVLVPPALVQKHAIRMYMSDVMQRPKWNPLYVSREYEEPGTSFAVQERDVNEQRAYSDEPLMEELTSLDLLESMRAAPPEPTGVAVAVRGDNVPWDCGEHPDLDRSHNLLGDHLRTVHMPGEVSPPPSPPPM